MLNKANCKKLIQEKDDFELAKMLQEYDSIGRTENGNGFANHSLTKDQEPSARTRRYYLRTRSKQISDGKDEAVPAKRAKLEAVVKQSGSNKVVVNGRKTRSSAPSNGDFRKKVEPLTRGGRKKQREIFVLNEEIKESVFPHSKLMISLGDCKFRFGLEVNYGWTSQVI